MSAPSSGMASLRAARALMVAIVSLAKESNIPVSIKVEDGRGTRRRLTFQFEGERVERARVAAQDGSHRSSCSRYGYICARQSWAMKAKGA